MIYRSRQGDKVLTGITFVEVSDFAGSEGDFGWRQLSWIRWYSDAGSGIFGGLGVKLGKPAPFLSLVENGRREVRLTFVNDLARALDVTPSELLTGEAPSRRAELEVAFQRAQEEPLYRRLRLPWVKPSSRVPDD